MILNLNLLNAYRENLLKLPAEQSMAYFLQMIMELISYESFIGKFTESIGWKYDVIMWNEDILRGERNTLNLADQPVVIDFMAKIIHILRNSDEKLSANHKDLRFQVVEAMDVSLQFLYYHLDAVLN